MNEVKPFHGLLYDTKVTEPLTEVTASPEEAIKMIDSSEYDIAFFMNPTFIEHVRRFKEKDMRLLKKSTFFYPKLLSVLVINRFGL
jgi:uncharacterized protein (DUF1015 family)